MKPSLMIYYELAAVDEIQEERKGERERVFKKKCVKHHEKGRCIKDKVCVFACEGNISNQSGIVWNHMKAFGRQLQAGLWQRVQLLFGSSRCV